MSKIQGTLAQWRDRLRRKELSPAELVNLTADAIEADRTTNAYISFDREAALHAAAGADISSPLAGIPIAVKDNINVLGQPTRCASRLLSPYVAPYDATSIRLLKEAGGIPLGRTNMDEFAMGASGENSAYGITRNPEAPDRIPGGSSSGSAAAVASATAVAALGSDTGGSIRQPAGHCGIVGLKPTYGRVSRYGLVAFASSLDQIGPMTRTVEDAAILLQAISGHDRKDSTSANCPVPDFEAALGRDVKGLKVGIPSNTLPPATIRAFPRLCKTPSNSWKAWARSWWKSTCPTRMLSSPPTISSPARKRLPTSPGLTACATERGRKTPPDWWNSSHAPVKRDSGRKSSAASSWAPMCSAPVTMTLTTPALKKSAPWSPEISRKPFPGRISS